MILLDRLVAGGLRFVLDQVARAVDAELNDEDALREELLAAQMRLELREIDPEAFADLEADILARIRAVGEARTGPAEAAFDVSGAEIETRLDHGERG